MLQACQDKQNTLDYKSSLQTNSKHVWTQDSQQSDWRGHEEKHRRGENEGRGRGENKTGLVYLPPSKRRRGFQIS